MRYLFLLVLAVALCACGPTDEDVAKVTAPMTPQERQIVERAFCTAVGGDPNRDIRGIAPAVNDSVERAGVEHVRTVMITSQWWSEQSDHKIGRACGKVVGAR